jgi:hypothetical protein
VSQLTVLGIDVSPGLLETWIDWLAPDEQPFFLTEQQAIEWRLPVDERQPTAEQRDTYRTYAVDGAAVRVSWLDESAYSSLPKATRAALVRTQVNHNRGAVPTVRRWQAVLGRDIRDQADGHRFVWWKSLVREAPEAILPRIVSEDLRPSRHAEVTAWPSTLPRARELAGTFPPGSGPNCFGTVMAAAGVAGADQLWMQREPFDQWLAANTKPGGRDDVPGTVFVWRDSTQAVQHAAITIGDGWMLHKPSQSWMTPRKIRTVAEVRRSTRTAGWRLGRRTLRL